MKTYYIYEIKNGKKVDILKTANKEKAKEFKEKGYKIDTVNNLFYKNKKCIL